MGEHSFTHSFYVGRSQDNCIIGLDLLERWRGVMDIAAGVLRTNFGSVTLSTARVQCLTPPLEQECTDKDASVECNRQAVEELLCRSSQGLMGTQRAELCALVYES